MAKSNMDDGSADSFAAAALVVIAIASLAFWLSGMPA